MKKQSKKIDIVYQFLVNRINATSTVVGSQLPTEIELSKKFNISRPTIQKALNILEQDGLIRKTQGVGTFVLKKDPSKIIFKKTSIGLLFPMIGNGEIFGPIANEIINKSTQYNFDLIWGGQFTPHISVALQMNKMLDFYLANNVSGLIMTPVELSNTCLEINKQTANKIRLARVPTVLVDADCEVFPYRSQFDLVSVDNHRLGYIMTKHFIEQGATRIDYCLYEYSAQTVRMRIQGYQQALLDANIIPQKSWIHSGNPHDLEFVNSMIHKNASNIICSNDSMAFQLVKTLEELGYSVPKDIRVAGVDDVKLSKYLNISLTTIAQPCNEIAKMAIETLLLRIHNPLLPIRTIMLDGKLRKGESSQLT